MSENSQERIAKYIARAGFCSRRQAEEYISEGLVKVNGKIITSPIYFVNGDENIIIADKPLKNKTKTSLWLFNKPSGYLVTNFDPQGRSTIFDILPRDLPRLISVGRLDLNSEGLILLTNDGEFARALELPKNRLPRVYKVRAFGVFNIKKLEHIAQGVTIEGVRYEPLKINIIDNKNFFKKPNNRQKPNNNGKFTNRANSNQDTQDNRANNFWLEITLTEGKNREIRKLLEHIDLRVNRLIRIEYGIFNLQDLPLGQIKKVNDHVLQKVKLGLRY